MASRSWFFATDGQQHGPYSEDQFRDLIGKGGIRPDTYVWSEGMAAWQFAGDVPGLLSGGAKTAGFSGFGGACGTRRRHWIALVRSRHTGRCLDARCS